MNYANSAGSATNATNATTASHVSSQYGGEVNFKGSQTCQTIYFNYRNADTLSNKGNTPITRYEFCNRNGTTAGVTLDAGNINTSGAIISGKVHANEMEAIEITHPSQLNILTKSGICSRGEDYNGWQPVFASTFSTQSVRSSKENFSNITDDEALNLLKIPPQHFDYKNGNKNQSGFIAEDVEPFFPEICAYQKDKETGEEKLFGLDYSKFTPYVVKLLQMLYDKMSALEQEKEYLEVRLRKVEEYLGI